ncbi:MAG: DNA polymerase IV, partial [Candidatus Puniceispirillum sp.]
YRLLGIGVSNFVTENWTPELALDDIAGHRRRQLEDAFDKLQERLGRDIVQTGRQFSRRKNLQEDD